MALPVLAGPFRCALIYNHEKQPLIELSIRVSLPLVDLLRALSQVAPPVGVKEPSCKGPWWRYPGRVRVRVPNAFWQLAWISSPANMAPLIWATSR